MRLTESDYYQYLRIHPALIHYVGLKEKLIPENTSLEQFLEFSAKDKFPSRNRLYEKIGYLDRFITENPYGLSAEDLEIAKGFKHFVQGRFWVMKYQKDYTVFLKDELAFGVLALNDPFFGFWGDNLPIMAETVLLPFKGKIVYDGMVQGFNISFGRGITSSLRNEYNKVKAQFGIITSLPVDNKTKSAKLSDADKLQLFMKSASSREENWNEIGDLLEENPSLENLYLQLCGKINVRKNRKVLKELGLTGYYFAIYNEVIIASGKTEKEVEAQLKKMLKKEDIPAVFIFKV